MVAAEALARGIPVLGPEVGDLPEAVGAASDGTVPAPLVVPANSIALGVGLRRWLADAPPRTAVRAAARDRRDSLQAAWDDTVDQVAEVLRA